MIEMQTKNISENYLEQCLKCSICTTCCPVSNVDTQYPGPKQAGPDGERYRMKGEEFFDEKALKMCLNCKRCEVACPQGVNIGDIIQSARIKYTKHRPSLRDMMLANTDIMGTISTKVAPIVNASLGLTPVKTMMHSILGIDKHRTLPHYSPYTFESWFKKTAAKSQEEYSRFISYFHGCYVNYNYPQLGKDLVTLMNAIGYGVRLLEKEKCCGVALIANGMSKQAKRQGESNINSMRKALNNGKSEAILTSSSTCTFTMRDEYEHLLHINNSDVKKQLMLTTRFVFQLIEQNKIQLVFKKDYKKRVAYHSACHMERMGWAIYSTELLRMIPGIDFIMLKSQCCGIAGTYGFKTENYKRSQDIGAPLFNQIKEENPEIVATDCETCKWQIEMSTGIEVKNPISILVEALDIEATKQANKN